MDLYHIWCDLARGENDLAFCADLSRYLEHLKGQGLVASFRITRKKLGLAPAELGEFHVIIETENLAQLERAFQHVATRAEPVEGLHAAVNQKLERARFALYRDFPDPFRASGQERF